jgi:hypothetical protein
LISSPSERGCGDRLGAGVLAVELGVGGLGKDLKGQQGADDPSLGPSGHPGERLFKKVKKPHDVGMFHVPGKGYRINKLLFYYEIDMKAIEK